MTTLTEPIDENYLRMVEEELMIRGGRWIASFDTAFRKFLVSNALKNVDTDKTHNKSEYATMVYGGVRSGGLLLSRAFAFMASPTYKVGLGAIFLPDPTRAKWSTIVQYLRESGFVKDVMEFEWMWILLFGHGKLPPKAADNLQRHTSRELGLLYADLKHKTIINSDAFISRRGAKLFNPANLDKKPYRSKFTAKRAEEVDSRKGYSS
ncbi:MAG: hypothetical protein ACFFFG_09690 [Candidatus Thorarchaeota archaeon]